jgi:hypothetical protein
MITTRSGSAIFFSTRYFTASVRSCCMAPVPHSPLPALRKALP